MSNGRGSPRRRQAMKQALSAEEAVCWLCLEELDFTISDTRDPHFVVIDEYIPVSKGGDPRDRSNCHLVHNCCNLRKNNRILERGAFADITKKSASIIAPKTSRRWL